MQLETHILPCVLIRLRFDITQNSTSHYKGPHKYAHLHKLSQFGYSHAFLVCTLEKCIISTRKKLILISKIIYPMKTAI